MNCLESGITDFRCRPPIGGFLEYFQLDRVEAIGRRVGDHDVPDKAFRDRSMELWIQALESAGVRRAVVPGRASPYVRQGHLDFPAAEVSNDLLSQLQCDFPGQITAFGGVDVSGMLHDPITEIRRCVCELGLAGVFIEPQRSLGSPVDDDRLSGVYEECSRLKIPVLLMTGPYAGSTVDLTQPAAVDRVASAFPDLSLVCGHGCWPYVHEMVAVAFKHPNVYVSPDFYIFLPGGEVYVDAANGFMSEQFLFGSGYPFRGIASSVNDYLQLPWETPKLVNKVMRHNAELLLKAGTT